MISEETIRIYNKKLEPNLWDEKKNLQPDIRLDLLKIAQDFYKSTDFKSEILDILLLGSSINYMWTPESDIDVHIVMDIRKEGLDPEHYRKNLDCFSGRWNTDHNISIKDHKVEIYLQDVTEKNSTPEKVRAHGAMFSLLNNRWLVPPKYEEPSLDKDAIKATFYDIKGQIDYIVNTKDVDDLKRLMKSIRDYRNKGMESEEGEFSTENIVFKALRHTGLLEKLKNAINSVYDNMVTIKETEEYINNAIFINERIFDDIIEEAMIIVENSDNPFILVGAVDENLHVAALKQEHVSNDLDQINKSQLRVNHKMLYQRYNLEVFTSVDWRYRSDINELLWWDWPSDSQSQATRKFLSDNYEIENPRYVNAKSLNAVQRHTFHDLEYKHKYNPLKELKEDLIFEDIYRMAISEIHSSDSFIVTGRVSQDLEINGEMYKKGREDMITHAMLRNRHGNQMNSIDWRYRADENTVYYLDQEPNADQKDAIYYFLKKRFGVNDRPFFVILRMADKQKTHFPQLSKDYKDINEVIENMEKTHIKHYL